MRRLLPMYRPSVYSAISLKEATSTLSQRTYASAENIPRLFSPIDKKHRIYKSLEAVTQPPLPMVPGKWEVKHSDIEIRHEQAISFGTLHYKLVEEYAPPSILIDEDYDIVHSSENAGRFLHFGGGEPSRNLLKVIHPDLRLDLH